MVIDMQTLKDTHERLHITTAQKTLGKAIQKLWQEGYTFENFVRTNDTEVYFEATKLVGREHIIGGFKNQ